MGKPELLEGEKILFEGRGAVFSEPKTSSLSMAKSNRIYLTNKRLCLPLSDKNAFGDLHEYILNPFGKRPESPWFDLKEIKDARMGEVKTAIGKATKAVEITFRNDRKIYVHAHKGWIGKDEHKEEFLRILKDALRKAK